MTLTSKGTKACLINFGLLSLIALCGCERPVQNSASPPPSALQSIERQEAKLDATVWRDERLAHEYEQVFVKLADDLRRAEDKAAVLAGFAFETIRIPGPKGSARKYELEIQAQEFTEERV